MKAPTDNLIRARYDDDATDVRAEDDQRTMFGHFAVFDTWTTIQSRFEGNFLERVGDTAFNDTFKERRSKIRVLYDHGKDPSIGNKPLGAPQILEPRDGGAYYEVPLFDTPYVRDLHPALDAQQLGASFRFAVTGEEWVDPKRSTDHNPNMLPERTITKVDLYEFGPVTFPAYDDATAGIRSRTDWFIDQLGDPLFLARLTERVGLHVVEQILELTPNDVRAALNNPDAAPQGTSGTPHGEREAFFRSLQLQGVSA